MAAAKRITDEPAFVLHRYDWSESSLILETFTRHHGRVTLVAKGAKRPSSNFRPVLLPLQPLRLAYSLSGAENADIHTLKGAEWAGGHIMPSGEALFSGYYLNELLLRLLARDDVHAALFDAYAGVVRVLASVQGDALEPVLRAFELMLLREIGLLPLLNAETLTMAPLEPQQRYLLVPEGGVRQMAAGERNGVLGSQWQTLAQAMAEPIPFGALLRGCAPVVTELKAQLRALLHYHCGAATLRTRQMMIDLQNL